MLITLKPHAAREDIAAVIARLQSRAAGVAGISLYLQPVQDLTIEDRVSRTQYQFTLETANAAELAEWTERLMARIARLPQITDVATDLSVEGLQAYVEIDRDSAGRLGITPAAIDAALYNAYGQRLVSTIFTQSNQYRVVLEVKPEFRQGPQAIGDLYVASPAGVQVPLSSIVRVVERPGPLAIQHMEESGTCTPAGEAT